MTNTAFTALFGGVLCLIAVPLVRRMRLRARLINLSAQTNSLESTLEFDTGARVDLRLLRDRLGKAGYWSLDERAEAQRNLYVLVAVFAVAGATFGVVVGSAVGGLIGLLVGLYSGVLVALYRLRWKARDFERELLFQLPITLEGLLLLVEAGLGILPAIAQMLEAERTSAKGNPAIRTFGVAYQLAAAGLPFSQALETVANAFDSRTLRHVLLHLDISSSEGGRLAPALRSLSDHCHSEWRLSVESRVRKLENLVVFPVFTSVLGLLLLTAAVPLVPLVEFAKSLGAQPTVASAPRMDTNVLAGNRGP